MNYFKLGGSVAAALLAGIIALNSYTVVQDGTEKTQKFLGEIATETKKAGFHVVNPFASFNTWDIKEKMLVIDNISIPSQDKFKSTADVTIKWSLNNADLTTMERTVGTQNQVEDKLLSVPMNAILRDAGREVAKAQDLFNSATQEKVQSYIIDRLSADLTPYGIRVHEVYIADITLPAVIQKAIVVTKELEEGEAQERANLEKQKLVYARQTAEATANALSAEQATIAANHATDAVTYKIRQQADADLYANNKVAEGNKELAKSVTADLLKLRNVEVEMEKAKRWSGAVPSSVTTFGGESTVAPVYHMGAR